MSVPRTKPVDRPVWRWGHERLLEQAAAGPLPNLAEPTECERELVAWGLLRWDAGAGVKPCRTLDEKAPLVHIRPAGLYITPAGLALLAAVESLDGTAAPSEQVNPRQNEKGFGPGKGP